MSSDDIGFPKPEKRPKKRRKGMSRSGFTRAMSKRRADFDRLYRWHVRPRYLIDLARRQGRLHRKDDDLPGDTPKVQLENLKWSEMPLCEVRAPDTECAAAGGTVAHQIHHKRGRGRRKVEPHLLVNTDHFAATCPECHEYLHAHPAWARENGWIISRHDKVSGSPEEPPQERGESLGAE